MVTGGTQGQLKDICSHLFWGIIHQISALAQARLLFWTILAPLLYSVTPDTYRLIITWSAEWSRGESKAHLNSLFVKKTNLQHTNTVSLLMQNKQMNKFDA